MMPPKWLKKALKPLFGYGIKTDGKRKTSQKVALWIVARCYELSLKAGLWTV